MNPEEKPLESWKEIGVYLNRDLRTARRWEKEEGLPIHRHSHKSRASVYAYPSEIDAWREARKVLPAPPPPRPLWKMPAFGLTMALCLVMAGNGLRPQRVEAQGAGKSSRQISTLEPTISVHDVSGDGRLMSFINWPTQCLSVRDLATGTDRCLAPDRPEDAGYPEDSRFSPDGKQIAYVWAMYLQLRSELRIIPTQGGAPRRIPLGAGNDDYAPPQGWSPDGKRLLVNRSLPDKTSQLAWVEVDTGKVQPLKSFATWENIRATLSPDGTMIAYQAQADPKQPGHDIYLLASDGSSGSVAVQHPADDVNPVWTPDAKKLLFLSKRTGRVAMFSVPVSGGKAGEAELVQADFPSGPMWLSRSGVLHHTIAGASGSNIYSADLGPDGKVAKPPMLEVEGYLNANRGASISPNGEQLAYTSQRSQNSVVIRSLKTKEEREVPTAIPMGGVVGWFPEGKFVLGMSGVPQGPGPSLYRVNVETGTTDLLLRPDINRSMPTVALSTDGRSIFFADYDDAKLRGTLTRFDIDTRRETEIKSVAGRFRGVVVSPDGKQLAYSTLDNGKGVDSQDGIHIEVMPIEGGQSRELFRGSLWQGTARWILSWSPDQKYILFTREGSNDSKLWRVPLAGGVAEEMGLFLPNGDITAPAIHADGKRLFFTYNRSDPGELWALENFLPTAAR